MSAKKKSVKVEVIKEPTIPAWRAESRDARVDKCLRFLYYLDILTESQLRDARKRHQGLTA